MDKFLYLIRVYLQASLRHFAKRDWKDEEDLEQYISVLEGTPFNPDDHKIPDGLRYHCLDIYVDELDRVDDKKDGTLPIQLLLRPIKTLASKSLSKTVRKRAQETLDDERLEAWLGKKKQENGNAEEGDAEWGGIED